MATIVTKKLSINEDNIENYCSADNVSFSVSGHAWRKWLNGSTDGYVILKDNGKSELYPTSTAHPFKADSTMSASRSAGTCTVDLQFAGTKVHEESYTSGSQTSKSKQNITDSAVTNSTRATEIKWHVYGKNGDNQRGDLIELTLYFNQYSAQALIGDGANGIQSVSVSNVSPYYGDTIAFGIKMVQGATFDGWYSDSACTQLVSAETTYSMAPTADVILYAKATTDATLYNVSAIAGAEIASVSVSDSIVPEGGTATFTAQVNEGCSFEAWYSDDTCTTVVSTENPYTATITADTTLYAKAHRNSLSMSVGTAEHGTATVSATTVVWGNDVTFTFTPEDETWELYGWYSDEGLTQLVSEENPYTFTATENVTLYPKVGAKRYTITLKRNLYIGSGITHNLTIASLYEDQLTDTERKYIKTGEFSKIDQTKIFDITTVKGNDMISIITATLKAPKNLLCVLYHTMSGFGSATYYTSGFALNKDPGKDSDGMQDKVTDPSVVCAWNYYSFYPTAADTYYVIVGYTCDCFAIAKDGIADVSVPLRVMQYAKAPFSAELSPGYAFTGWYSDDACTKLVTTDNPAQITCPSYTGDSVSSTSLTLYAKAAKATYSIGVGAAEHCTASVSAATAQYGDEVIFSCVVDEGYEFKGWYSDEGLTQLVSESAEYVHSVTGDVTLWAKVELIQYTITLTRPGKILQQFNPSLKLAVINYAALTREEINQLKTGDYDKIEQSKVLKTAKASGLGGSDVIAKIECPYGLYVAMHVSFNIPANNTSKYTQPYINDTTWWPYYWYAPTGDENFTVGESGYRCDCTALPLGGIEYVDVTTPVVQTKKAIFTAEVKPGHKFDAWYSDETCTIKVSTDNPATVTTPQGELINDLYNQYGLASLTLYAKAISTTASATGISLKRNSSWSEAKSVYRKVSDTWVADTDYCKTLLSQKDRIGTFVHIV